jgi:sugar phosphate isomerase/epimerase
MSHEYGVDLIALFHPRFWGVGSEAELLVWCAEHPGLMWEKILDTLTEADISHVELTFPPLGYQHAIAGFGSPGTVKWALAERSLDIVSGLHAAIRWDELAEVEAYEDVAPYAEFLAEVGASHLVLAMPESRIRTLDDSAERHRAAQLDRLAPVLDGVARRLATFGVRLSIYTEAHSIAVRAADIRRILSLTDPEIVGLCPDSAHLTLMGEDPASVVAEFADRVWISHWKDALGAFPEDLVLSENLRETHREYLAPVGEGVVDWLDWALVMKSTPAAGLRLLDLDSSRDPASALKRSRAFAEALPV